MYINSFRDELNKYFVNEKLNPRLNFDFKLKNSLAQNSDGKTVDKSTEIFLEILLCRLSAVAERSSSNNVL